MAIAVGQDAPDFTLLNESSEEVTLSSHRGSPVVLVFYPLDFSGVCTTEHCDIRDNHQGWLDAGAVVYGISRDSRFTHAAFKAQERLPYSLLQDMQGEVAQQYDTWNADAGIATRLTVVINREGKVVYTTSSEVPTPRDHSEVAAAIASA